MTRSWRTELKDVKERFPIISDLMGKLIPEKQLKGLKIMEGLEGIDDYDELKRAVSNQSELEVSLFTHVENFQVINDDLDSEFTEIEDSCDELKDFLVGEGLIVNDDMNSGEDLNGGDFNEGGDMNDMNNPDAFNYNFVDGNDGFNIKAKDKEDFVEQIVSKILERRGNDESNPPFANGVGEAGLKVVAGSIYDNRDEEADATPQREDTVTKKTGYGR